MERLTFNIRSDRSRIPVAAGRDSRVSSATARVRATAKALAAAARDRYDWDYLWMLVFTALLFFRPQDQVPPLEVFHLAELAALAGLAAMAVRRLSAGQTIAKINTEVIGVIVLGGIILFGVPFSFWPGGSMKVFTDLYIKVILIFALMMSTLTSPKRLRQLTMLMVLATGYIAFRGVFDYVRGVNLVEGDRLRGAVGGMFQNPNDLALNLVTFLAPTLFIIIEDRGLMRRLVASLVAVLMLAAIVATKSRSGFLGLIGMVAVVGFYTVRVRPGVLVAGVLAGLLALPMMPQSFWDRMDSITNAQEDQTGSREARLRLLEQGLEVFAENPVTGIGAGQFQNYNDAGTTVEKWRVTHNVWLQVASELGLFGLLTFAFLVVRSYRACFNTLRMLKPPRKRRSPSRAAPTPAWGRAKPSQPPIDPTALFTKDERHILDINAKGMLAGMVGWTICSFFASVAFNWTFYYVFALAVAGREIVAARRAAVIEAEAAEEPARAGRLVRVGA